MAVFNFVSNYFRMKRLLVFMFVLALLGSCGKEGCTDPVAKNYNPDAAKDNGSCEFIEIGDTMQGGIVFYLDGNGGGLIAANGDEGEKQWGCSGTWASTDTVIGSGLSNTQNIIYSCGQGIAANYCINLNLNGYNDWFLPSKNELDYLFNNIVGSFSYNQYYWSSSEVDSINTLSAYAIIIKSGVEVDTVNKTTYCKVRPVRAF